MGTTSTHTKKGDSTTASSWSKQGSDERSQSWFSNLQSVYERALVLLPLAYLWFQLINNLRVEWTTNPQYAYGWLVPFLCIGLLVRRWHAVRSTEIGDRRSEVGKEKQTAEDERGKVESRKQKSRKVGRQKAQN